MPDKFSISCPALPRTVRALQSIGAGMAQAVARGLRGWAEETARVAKDRCPVDTGNLMNSIHVPPIEVDDKRAKVAIVTGGTAAPYAIHVHENLSPTVRWRKPGSGPKFIENPINERWRDLDAAIAGELGKEFGKLK